jgi:hypothetical protein
MAQSVMAALPMIKTTLSKANKIKGKSLRFLSMPLLYTKQCQQ